eukprot:13230097-Alexandrium_andersonii.AAC.1
MPMQCQATSGSAREPSAVSSASGRVHAVVGLPSKVPEDVCNCQKGRNQSLCGAASSNFRHCKHRLT